MTKKSSKPSRNQSITIFAGIAGLILLCIYLVTGSDMFGIFGGGATQTPGSPSSDSSWWQVYFTDPNQINNPDNPAGSIEAELIRRIDQAQNSIHIAAFEFNLTPVAEALIAAHKRGVDVKWVTDDENGLLVDEEDDHGQFALLEKAGIQVRADDRGALMHNKFIIFDERTTWTGSTNLTVNGIFHNNNNVLVIDSPRLAAIYELQFGELWDGSFGPGSPSNVSSQRTSVNGTPIQVLFSPEDEAVSHIVPLLAGAKESIRFMAFSFTHDALGDAMLERAQAGVDVQGIFERRGSETEYSELPVMYCSGIPVRQDGNPRTFHHKVIVIDGQTVITGSLNFSANADESNNENVIILTNPEIAAKYLQEFNRRWAEGEAPDPAAMGCR